MTKCNISILVFQDPKSRKIEFNFSGGDISSGGGLLLEVISKVFNFGG